MEKYKKNKIKIPFKLLSSIGIALVIVFLSVATAALNTNMFINGEAYLRVEEDIRITNLEIKEYGKDAYEQFNNKYSKDKTNIYVSLPTIDSYIVYEVTITNKSNYKYKLIDLIEMTHTNENIKYELNGIEQGDVFNSNTTKTFTIKLSYNSQELPEDTTDTLILNYVFKRFTKIRFEKNYLQEFNDNKYINMNDITSYKNSSRGTTTTKEYELMFDDSVPSNKYTKITMTSGDAGGNFIVSSQRLIPGETYTWSVWLKSNINTRIQIGHEQQPNKELVSLTTEWQRFTKTFVADNDGNYNFIFYKGVYPGFSGSTSWIEDEEIYISSLEIIQGEPEWVAEKEILKDEKIGILPNVDNDYSRFLGWYTLPVGGEKIDENTIAPEKDVTYYAHWENIRKSINIVVIPKFVSNHDNYLLTNYRNKGSEIERKLSEKSQYQYNIQYFQIGVKGIYENLISKNNNIDLIIIDGAKWSIDLDIMNELAKKYNVITISDDAEASLDLISSVSGYLNANQKLASTAISEKVFGYTPDYSIYDDSATVINFNSDVEVLYKLEYDDAKYSDGTPTSKKTGDAIGIRKDETTGLSRMHIHPPIDITNQEQQDFMIDLIEYLLDY